MSENREQFFGFIGKTSSGIRVGAQSRSHTSKLLLALAAARGAGEPPRFGEYSRNLLFKNNVYYYILSMGKKRAWPVGVFADYIAGDKKPLRLILAGDGNEPGTGEIFVWTYTVPLKGRIKPQRNFYPLNYNTVSAASEAVYPFFSYGELNGIMEMIIP